MKTNEIEFTSKDLYRKLFEDSQDILLIIEYKTGSIVHANAAACNFYKYTYDEITSINISSINVLSEEEIKEEMDKATLERRKYFNFHHKISDGEIRQVEVKSNIIKIQDNQYIFSVVTDAKYKQRHQLMLTGFFYESPNAMAIVDENNYVMAINSSFRKLFGYKLSEVNNNRLDNLIATNETNILLNLDEVMQGNIVNEDSIRFTKDGIPIDVNIVATPHIIGFDVVGALIVYTDITEQVKIKKEINLANRSLLESKEKLKLILNSTVEAIYGMDLEGNCTFCNESGLKMLGYSNQEELIGKNIHYQIHHSYKDGKTMSLTECKILSALLEGEGAHSVDEVFWRSDGSCFDVEYYSYPQFQDDEIVGAVVTFMDITERKKYEEHIKYMSNHDYVTDLFNRKYFEEELKRVDSDDNLPISIIYSDLNGLKLTNDVFGHTFGDELLRKTADVLKSTFRDKGIIARVGGDEFAILLPNTEEDVVKELIDDVKLKLANEKISAIKGSISLGYMTKVSSKQDIEKLLTEAECAMYKDKMLNQKDVTRTMIQDLIDTLHSSSDLEKEHSINVSRLSKNLAKKMGMTDTDIERIGRAGYLHDIGKIVLHENVNSKNLTLEEIKSLERHPIIGYRILTLFDETIDIADVILYHHEFWNGTGYPKGIKNCEIPVMSRMLSVVETYDRLIYKHKLKKEDALIKIKEQSGIKFDPDIVNNFVDMITGD